MLGTIYRGVTFLKDEEAFRAKKGICYIPENAYLEEFWDGRDKATVKEVIAAGVEATGCFTYRDILNECDGSEVMAEYVFDLLDWTYPSTLIDELDDESLEYIAEREKQISQEKHPRVYVIPASIKWRDTGEVQTVYFSETSTKDLLMDDQIFFCGVTREELLASSGELSISDEWDVLAVGHREPWYY